MIERNDIPLGVVRDSFGCVLTFRESTGYWHEYTRDSHGYELTFKDYVGEWSKYTRDSSGNVLTYENSAGYWYEYTRDSLGRIVAYKDRDVGEHVYLAHDEIYGLRYEYDQYGNGRYKAGCRDFSYEEAVKHWNMRLLDPCDKDSNRAKLFLDAIEKNEATLKSVV